MYSHIISHTSGYLKGKSLRSSLKMLAKGFKPKFKQIIVKTNKSSSMHAYKEHENLYGLINNLWR